MAHGAPQVMLLSGDLQKGVIHIEGIAMASVVPFQSVCVDGDGLDTPEAD